MKIDSNLKPQGSGNVGGSRQRSGVAASGAGAATEVQISAASAQLAGAGNGAPVDSARVAEIKQAISEGRFKINPEAIADGLIDTARDLLQSQRKA